MDSFFGIGMPELILILLVAGIVMGPERIGVAARWLGRTTGQLQAVSRSFVRQLNSELDEFTGSTEIRDTVQEMQDLQGELAKLKQELMSITNGLSKDTKRTLTQTKEELERTIAPASLVSAATRVKEEPLKTVAPSSQEPTAIPLTPEALPSRIEIEDDPD